MTSAGRPPTAGEWGGGVVSSTSIASIAGLKASSRAATRTGTFRGDGSARANAALPNGAAATLTGPPARPVVARRRPSS